MNATTIQREQLYEQLWNEPTVKVAMRYGLSDTGLSKVCDRLNIPKPPRGYWAKIDAGQVLPKASLPLNGRSVYQRGRVVHNPKDCVAYTIPESTIYQLEVSRPMTIAECLPITQLVAASSSMAKLDGRGWPRYMVGNLISIEVSPRCQPRSFLVINALFETLIAAGHYSDKLAVVHQPAPIRIGAALFRFQLREDSPIAKPFAKDALRNESQLFNSSGVFNIHAYLESGKYRVATLRDTCRTCVEERMSRFVVRLRRFALTCS